MQNPYAMSPRIGSRMYHFCVMKSEMPTVIWVIQGSSEDSPGFSAAISSKIPTKTGTMNATTAAMTRMASPKTTAGYIIAERTWR